jgi:hypothetical protein
MMPHMLGVPFQEKGWNDQLPKEGIGLIRPALDLIGGIHH